MRLAHLMFSLAGVMALAAPLQPSMRLDRMNLTDAIAAVYGDALHDSFAIDPELLRSDKQVMVQLVAPREPDKLRAFMADYLASLGVSVEHRGDAYLFKPSAPADKAAAPSESLIYRLKARPTSYFADLLPAVFPHVQFSFHRGVDAPPISMTEGGSQTPGASSPPPQPQDTGTNAYSQIDKQADVFVALGSKADLAKVKALLAELDTPVPQVVVHAYLYEVNTRDNTSSGFGLAMSLLGGRFGLTLGQAQGQGDAVTLHAGGVQAVVDAFSGDTHYKLLSSPSLRVIDGGNGRFSVGSDVPVLGAVQQDRNGNPIQSVEYKPSGVILDVAPHVMADMVAMHVAQQESSFISTTTGVNNSPTLLKREIQTDLTFKPGDVVVMGSLSEHKDTTSDGGQAWYLPFMHQKASDVQRNDLVLVLSVDVLR